MIPVVTWGGYLTMGYFPKFSHVHQIIKFQVCLQILSLIACCSTADTLAFEQSKWNELRQTSSLEWRTNNSAKQRKAKKSWVGGNLHLIAARNTAKWWWLSSAAKFPPFRPLFAAIRSTLILTLPPACLRACGTKQLKESDMTSHFFFFSLKTWFIVSRCSHLFWRRSISPSPSSRAPPHQKFPFPSENGNFTIFAAYQSNSRGGEMEMWK